MIEVSTELSLNKSRRCLILIAFIAMVMCASLLPMGAIAASATTSIKNVVSSVSLDGSSELPLAADVIGTALSGAPSAGLFSNNVVPVTLGAPAAGNAVVLADCGWAGFGCLLNFSGDVVVGAAVCIGSVITLFTLWSGTCVKDLKKILTSVGTLAMWKISVTITKMAISITKGLQTLSIDWSNWILADELGGKNTLTSPVLSCQIAQGAQATGNCKDSWFLGQYEVMRQIAMFLLLPLFMLVVIQSILKGSMFMLLRSALVILPVAIIGTVVAVFFAQLLLNLSDDFVQMITSYTSSTTAYATSFGSSVGGMDATKVNYFAVFWMFLLLFATVVIYIELLLRQLGVYMAAFFLPLAFAALVWPASAGFAKKMLELLIGLIFSKVFIATAVSLGIAAFANVSSSNSTIPGATNDATTAGLGSLISGTLIFCTAAFVGTKVIAISPAAMTAAEGRVMPLSNYSSKFQLSNVTMSRAAQLKNWSNNNRGGHKNFDGNSSGKAAPYAPPAARRQQPIKGSPASAPAPPKTTRK